MNWWDSITAAAGRAWGAIIGLGGLTGDALAASFRVTTRLLSGAIYQLTHPLNTLENNAAILAGLVSGNMTAVLNAIRRLEGWSTATIKQPILNHTNRQLARVWAQFSALRRWVEQQIDYAEAALKRWAWRLVATERRYRIEGDAAARAYAQAQARWALQTANREAASGYQATRAGRVSVITRLLDAVAGRVPVVRELTGRVITILVDVIEIDNPLLRLAATFLLGRVISALGIDKLMGEAADALLSPLLANPNPKNLHDVITDLSTRVGALEAQWAQFMANGGPQVEQAGQQWRDITGLAVDAALLAFAVGAVADPAATAKDLSAVVRPVGTSTIEAMGRILAGK